MSTECPRCPRTKNLSTLSTCPRVHDQASKGKCKEFIYIYLYIYKFSTMSRCPSEESPWTNRGQWTLRGQPRFVHDFYSQTPCFKESAAQKSVRGQRGQLFPRELQSAFSPTNTLYFTNSTTFIPPLSITFRFLIIQKNTRCPLPPGQVNGTQCQPTGECPPFAHLFTHLFAHLLCIPTYGLVTEYPRSPGQRKKEKEKRNFI